MKVKCNRFSRFFIIHFFYPLVQLFTMLLPKSQTYFQYLFIKLNNLSVLCSSYKFPKNPKILILLPHCLQFDDCVFKITKTIDNCKKCGKCVIKDFVEIKENLQLPISVANGGTLARKAILDNKPDLVIACACERDLATGIYDAYPFFVYGILNERPNGPCVNTTIDINKIKLALEKFQ